MNVSLSSGFIFNANLKFKYDTNFQILTWIWSFYTCLKKKDVYFPSLLRIEVCLSRRLSVPSWLRPPVRELGRRRRCHDDDRMRGGGQAVRRGDGRCARHRGVSTVKWPFLYCLYIFLAHSNDENKKIKNCIKNSLILQKQNISAGFIEDSMAYITYCFRDCL